MVCWLGQHINTSLPQSSQERLTVQDFRDREFKHMRVGNEEPGVAARHQVCGVGGTCLIVLHLLHP